MLHMIGGADIVIPAHGDPAELDACVHIIREYWPNATFEDALTGQKYSQYADIPFGQLREILVYSDSAAQRAWDRGDGAAVDNSMIYLIRSSDSITVVVDIPDDPEMKMIIGSIRLQERKLKPIVSK